MTIAIETKKTKIPTFTSYSRAINDVFKGMKTTNIVISDDNTQFVKEKYPYANDTVYFDCPIITMRGKKSSATLFIEVHCDAHGVYRSTFYTMDLTV